MFVVLVSTYKEYQEARKSKSYNADTVQAMGIRFCDEWKRCKEELMKRFDIPEKDFDYSLHHTIMPRLMLEA